MSNWLKKKEGKKERKKKPLLFLPICFSNYKMKLENGWLIQLQISIHTHIHAYKLRNNGFLLAKLTGFI